MRHRSMIETGRTAAVYHARILLVLTEGGRSKSSIRLASRLRYGPNFPHRARANAVSSRAAMKLTAVKLRTMSITLDSVMTKRNTAKTAMIPCTNRSTHENMSPQRRWFLCCWELVIDSFDDDEDQRGGINSRALAISSRVSSANTMNDRSEVIWVARARLLVLEGKKLEAHPNPRREPGLPGLSMPSPIFPVCSSFPTTLKIMSIKKAN
mmetsp:Transcript_14876/g.37469  ORF Transcript_14876/g.37469 Transcript_14876/m.37469 type:complete len:210 (+) Transcript_14876:754-1383(+)